MVGIHGGNQSQMGRQVKEGTVELVGLHHHKRRLRITPVIGVVIIGDAAQRLSTLRRSCAIYGQSSPKWLSCHACRPHRCHRASGSQTQHLGTFHHREATLYKETILRMVGRDGRCIDHQSRALILETGRHASHVIGITHLNTFGLQLPVRMVAVRS